MCGMETTDDTWHLPEISLAKTPDTELRYHLHVEQAMQHPSDMTGGLGSRWGLMQGLCCCCAPISSYSLAVLGACHTSANTIS